jgi:hypothetical protein
MRHSAESNFIIEYLRKYEFLFKTALVHESGDLGVVFAEKTKGRKSRDTVPLRVPLFIAVSLFCMCWLKHKPYGSLQNIYSHAESTPSVRVTLLLLYCACTLCEVRLRVPPIAAHQQVNIHTPSRFLLHNSKY